MGRGFAIWPLVHAGTNAADAHCAAEHQRQMAADSEKLHLSERNRTRSDAPGRTIPRVVRVFVCSPLAASRNPRSRRYDGGRPLPSILSRVKVADTLACEMILQTARYEN
jgi:hypothetical protein